MSPSDVSIGEIVSSVRGDACTGLVLAVVWPGQSSHDALRRLGRLPRNNSVDVGTTARVIISTGSGVLAYHVRRVEDLEPGDLQRRVSKVSPTRYYEEPNFARVRHEIRRNGYLRQPEYATTAAGHVFGTPSDVRKMRREVVG